MNTASKPTIGFVGLGHMGGNMAARLLEAGYAVHGETRTRDRAQPLVDAGLHWGDTAREVTERVEIVFTSLPDDAALETVASGPDGILAGLDGDKTWIDMSTVSPRVSRELAARVRERGAVMLDAPVSGSVPQVQTGTLTIMVGGVPTPFVGSNRSCASWERPRTSVETGTVSFSSSRSTSASPSRCSPSPRGSPSPTATASTVRSRSR